jgi:hypothetical protein
VTALAASAPVDQRAAARRLHLAPHGLAWLVWRRHRASFRLWIFCGAVLTAYLVYWHLRYHATFSSDTFIVLKPTVGLPPDIGLSAAAFLLLAAPLLIGVVFGAQLFERPFTDGTIALICTQSVTAAAWVRAELAASATMLVLCVTPCAAAFTWDYRVDSALQGHWHGIWAFDAVGPAAVGICLVALFLGAASGLVWRRGAPAKGLALVLVIAFEAGLSEALPHLLPASRLVVEPANGGQVALPFNAWVLGTGNLGVSGYYARYLPCSDLAPLQWIAAGICVVVCAVVAAACVRLLRRRSG